MSFLVRNESNLLNFPLASRVNSINVNEHQCLLCFDDLDIGAGYEGSPPDTGPATATTSAIGAAEGSPSATMT
ncbi:hypothetical protein V6N13_013530 [Hibiscus sabdariffa]